MYSVITHIGTEQTHSTWVFALVDQTSCRPLFELVRPLIGQLLMPRTNVVIFFYQLASLPEQTPVDDGEQLFSVPEQPAASNLAFSLGFEHTPSILTLEPFVLMCFYNLDY